MFYSFNISLNMLIPANSNDKLPLTYVTFEKMCECVQLPSETTLAVSYKVDPFRC